MKKGCMKPVKKAGGGLARALSNVTGQANPRAAQAIQANIARQNARTTGRPENPGKSMKPMKPAKPMGLAKGGSVTPRGQGAVSRKKSCKQC